MKSQQLHIKILPVVLFLLAGMAFPFLCSAEVDDRSDPAAHHLFFDLDTVEANQMMPKIPTASAGNALQHRSSGISSEEMSPDVLKDLIFREKHDFFSRVTVNRYRPFFRKIALLPLAGGAAIGAP